MEECSTCRGTGEEAGTEFYRGRYWTIWTPCTTCRGTGKVAAPVVEEAAVPDEREAPGVFTVAEHRVTAPGFTPESFDRAVHRAHLGGITVQATSRPGTVSVTSGTHQGMRYVTTRHVCSCVAGRQGRACKHRAMAIFLADVCGEPFTPAGRVVAARAA